MLSILSSSLKIFTKSSVTIVLAVTLSLALMSTFDQLSNSRVETIVLPKVHHAQDLSRIVEHIPRGRPLNIIASIESARSLWGIGDISSWRGNDGVKVIGLLVRVVKGVWI